MAQKKLPLAGVRVVEFGQYIAAPGAAMLLADLGARAARLAHLAPARCLVPSPAVHLHPGRRRTQCAHAVLAGCAARRCAYSGVTHGAGPDLGVRSIHSLQLKTWR